MNPMPYDHPLDWQGHITLTHHSGVAAYNSYIRLVTTGIPVTVKIKGKEVYQFYPDLVGTVPDPHSHNIWGSLHFLPLVSNVFLSWYDSGTFLSHLSMALTTWGPIVLTKCAGWCQPSVAASRMLVWVCNIIEILCHVFVKLFL